MFNSPEDALQSALARIVDLEQQVIDLKDEIRTLNEEKSSLYKTIDKLERELTETEDRYEEHRRFSLDRNI